MALIKSKQLQSILSTKIDFSDNPNLQFLSETQISKWDDKYDAQLVTTSVEGLMSAVDKTKLDDIAENANNYSHPDSHDASMITETTDLQFVSQNEKDSWADKYTQTEIDNLVNNLESGLEWKESVATYSDIETTYPSPTEGSVVSVDDESGQTYRYNGTEWIKFLSLGYNKATGGTDGTDGTDGLMSSEDKYKLDGVEDNANNYTHPANHDPSIITEDDENRFVSDTQISDWDAKAETTEATESSKGLMPAEDKRKLNAGVTQQKDLVLSVTNGQTSISTGVATDDSLSHKTNVADGQLTINGFKQTIGVDFTVSTNDSNELEINWISSDFDLESDDVLVFTFTKLL